MSAKHTPGPWVIEFARNGYPYSVKALNGDDKQPGAVGKSVLRWGSISLPSSNEGLANARLIAAAPELLEALKEMLRAHEVGVFMAGSGLDRARAAIAKATGEVNG